MTTSLQFGASYRPRQVFTEVNPGGFQLLAKGQANQAVRQALNKAGITTTTFTDTQGQPVLVVDDTDQDTALKAGKKVHIPCQGLLERLDPANWFASRTQNADGDKQGQDASVLLDAKGEDASLQFNLQMLAGHGLPVCSQANDALQESTERLNGIRDRLTQAATDANILIRQDGTCQFVDTQPASQPA